MKATSTMANPKATTPRDQRVLTVRAARTTTTSPGRHRTSPASPCQERPGCFRSLAAPRRHVRVVVVVVVDGVRARVARRGGEGVVEMVEVGGRRRGLLVLVRHMGGVRIPNGCFEPGLHLRRRHERKKGRAG